MKRTQIKTTFRYYDQGLREWDEGNKRDLFLDSLATYVGRIIMEFNSLEDELNWYIKEKLSHSEGKDETIFLFLSKMGANDKLELLIKLYGQCIYRDYELKPLRDPLKVIESKLLMAIKVRNRYAHTNWAEIYNDKMFKIKTEAKKDGVYHTFLKFDEPHLIEDLKLIEQLHDELYEFDEYFLNMMNTNTSRLIIFSYGSNMFSKRLIKRVPSAKQIGIGKISGYMLTFSKVSTDKSGKATLLKTNNIKDIVWGTISTILKEEKHLLSSVEIGYQEQYVKLLSETNEDVIALAYIADESTLDGSLLPYDWYKACILLGAKENNLPQEYVKYIESISSIVDIDPKRAEREWNKLES